MVFAIWSGIETASMLSLFTALFLRNSKQNYLQCVNFHLLKPRTFAKAIVSGPLFLSITPWYSETGD